MADLGSSKSAALGRLRTLSERSMQQAGESLTALLGHPVRLRVAGIHRLSIRGLPALVAEADTGRMVALQFQITGEGGGHMVILLPLATIFRMLRALLGTADEPRPLSPLERSAVEEIGNVLTSSFLTELGELVGKRLIPSTPRIHLEDIPRLIQQVAAALDVLGPEILVVQALLQDPQDQIIGRFFVLPEVASLVPIVQGADDGRRVWE